MRLVQFIIPHQGRRVGRVEGNTVIDLTSINPNWTYTYHLFSEARRDRKPVDAYLVDVSTGKADTISYDRLWRSKPGDAGGWILPPLDHPDPACCLISGTGLTHLGSMEKRAEMHTSDAKATQKPKTDSQKMFEMGLVGGKPAIGLRGVQPE